MKTIYTVLCSALAVALTGCPQPTSQPDPRRARAKQAAQALGKGLKARLQAAIAKDGLPGGISACKLAAPEIAVAVGREQGLQLGRTSFKLRNPKNAPPAWARLWVEERVAEPRFADAEDGSLRALLPIKLEALCVSCHGPQESLGDEVEQALAEHYPDDQATGFQAGDLRGWFWVEVPPR